MSIAKRLLMFGLLATMTTPGISPAHHAATDFEDLRRSIEGIRTDADVPGAALVIVDGNGTIWSAGFGVADNTSREPATPDTVFRIGSVTKIFTAAALVQLARRDNFSLDDPVSKHVPPGLFFNRWQNEQPITVAHLMEHTSGFRDWTKAEFDYNIPVDLEAGLAFSPQSRTAQWKPGMHSVYSNSNYGLAGLVLERVSGKGYEAVIRDTLFTPLGMHSATSLQARTSNLATGYDSDGITPIPYWHMIQRPAAAINATPREMGALVTMLLNRGRYHEHTVLTLGEVQRMELPHTSLAARNGLQFGYGLGMYSYYRDRFRFMGHGGDGDGYLSRFGYCRQLGVGYFVTINSYNARALRRMRRAIEEQLIRDHRPPAAPTISRLDERRLARYTGRYALAAWRFDWQSSRRSLLVGLAADGSLYTENRSGERTPLLAVSKNTFRRAGENGATSGFFEADGRLFFEEDDSWAKITDPPRDTARRSEVDAPLPGRSGAEPE
ncbi:MAG: beta-lactamase family protein [Betaproteobacteria bacterium]|nr:MAG: beta-lactamase family protein [Betaproteobacteria bacterium]